jgi:hypothetical protein
MCVRSYYPAFPATLVMPELQPPSSVLAPNRPGSLAQQQLYQQQQQQRAAFLAGLSAFSRRHGFVVRDARCAHPDSAAASAQLLLLATAMSRSPASHTVTNTGPVCPPSVSECAVYSNRSGSGKGRETSAHAASVCYTFAFRCDWDCVYACEWSMFTP